MTLRTSEESTTRPVSALRKVWGFVTRLNITFWIILFLLLGILLGYLAPGFASNLNPISNIFIYMVKCLVVPLIFSTLTVGVAGHGADLKKIGLMAIRAFVYFEIATTIALAVGLIAINIVKPGVGVDLNAFNTVNSTEVVKKEITWETELYGIIPESFFKAAADNIILQIVFCSIIFSVAMIKVNNDRYTGPVLAFLDGLSHIMFKVTNLVMNFAPFGVLASMAVTVSKSGLGILVNLGKLVGTLYVALFVFMLLVFVPILLILKIPAREFARAVARPALITFSTSSSEAALPIAMENMEKFGVPKQIVAFVIPTGYSFNLDGSTLYLAVTSIFVAQAAGHSLSVGDQLMMMLTLMLTSKGVAAVPRGAIVVLAAALNSFNLPQQAISVILGVDQLMNMARAGVNVIGNCLSCVVVAKWQGEFRQPGWELALHQEDATARSDEHDVEKQAVKSNYVDLEH